MDLAYVKVMGVFYFLVMVRDGFSRYLLDWELMPDMLGTSVEDFMLPVPRAVPRLRTEINS